MSTISNATRYWVGVDVYGTTCHREQENGKWVKYEDYEELENELLALRKERERVVPIVVPDLHKDIYHFLDLNEGFPVERFKADYVIAWMLENYPPAPIVPDDSLPFDSQIAEYEQMMEAELKAAASMAHKVKSELSQMAEKLVRDTTELAATLSAETDTTAQQFESLAGKAVVPEGWKLVPVELTKEMRGKIHPFAEATCLDCGRQVVADCEDNVTASWNDMLAVAPEPCK
ncbi:hypothetical protein QLY67_015515 [Cronobacter turicensis]|uniref:hypothetical protein n=1 Tax=Cronobacter turicensis TaxID=413502 RepID=UPI0024AF03A1|nr:hypothetical protein [Cronobacter turicensis]MDI7404265.1 hypothetical protein [Cronobacter turicensis]